MYTMPIHLDFIGVGVLLLLVVSVQVLSHMRTVRAIKTHAQSLRMSHDQAIQSGDHSVHYEKAHIILLALQKEKLNSLQQTIIGRLCAAIVSDTFYEITSS